LAKCKLDLNHPKFRIIGHASEPDLNAGLEALRELISRDHALSGWFNQPMRRFPEHQNRVWVWDFRPAGETSSTRKGWRVYAYRFDLNAPEPIPASAFVCFDKDEAPKIEYAKFLAKELKRFLAVTFVAQEVESKFRHQTLPDGATISLCFACGETAAMSDDPAEIELAENTHECPQ
jgi:hypothetical protein